MANNLFDINNFYGLKLLKGLRLDLSHLRYPKFRDTFFKTICPLFHSARQSLLINIKHLYIINQY